MAYGGDRHVPRQRLYNQRQRQHNVAMVQRKVSCARNLNETAGIVTIVKLELNVTATSQKEVWKNDDEHINVWKLLHPLPAKLQVRSLVGIGTAGLGERSTSHWPMGPAVPENHGESEILRAGVRQQVAGGWVKELVPRAHWSQNGTTSSVPYASTSMTTTAG